LELVVLAIFPFKYGCHAESHLKDDTVDENFAKYGTEFLPLLLLVLAYIF
jgi:hypothetical protein